MPARPPSQSGLGSWKPPDAILAILPWLQFLSYAFICYSDSGRLNSDLESYIDIGEALVDGRWREAANATWGPAYGLLIAGLAKITGSGRMNEAALITTLQIIVSACVVVLTAATARMVGGLSAQSSWRIGASLLVFASSHACVVIIGPSRPSPDMCLLACHMLVALSLLRCWLAYSHGSLVSRSTLVALGLTCGVAYLLKQSYAPCIALTAAAVYFLSTAKRLRNAAAVLALAALPVLPWGVFLSAHRGRFTLGDNGRWNYNVFVNRVDNRYWENVDPKFGVPLHPPKKLAEGVYSFAGPYPRVAAPMNYDLAWWSDGEISRFNPAGMIRQLRENAGALANLFRHKGPFGVLAGVSCCLILLFVRQRQREWPWQLAAIVWSTVPVLAYSFVHIEYRHVVPFLYSLSVAAAALCVSTRRSEAGAAILPVVGALTILGACYDNFLLRKSVLGEEFRTKNYQELGVRLRALGIAEGAQVAILGEPTNPHWYWWPRHAGVQLTVVIKSSPSEFSSRGQAARETLMEVLRQENISAIVAAGSQPPGTLYGFYPAIKDFSVLPLNSGPR